uniref:Calcineurin-like phosphoesterase domain-containing protein n=1 Tax=Romanomermis culicivorax TaxID=13658 RepID=A0A915IQX6_ROMCU
MYGALTLYTKNVEIKIDNLPEKFKNFRIALLSDLHASPTIDRSEFWSIVNKTNALYPDIVVIAGDLIDGSLESLKDSVLPVKHFQSNFGVFFATGNHEYYYGKIDDWFPYLLNDLNVNVLHNSNYKIKKFPADETYLCLAGVDDIYSESFKLKGHSLNASKALNGCGHTFPRILISHNPKGARLAVMQESSIDLILSGHVHAGQMYVTAPLMYVTTPYFYGLYRHENGRTQIYVTSGCHFWAAPLKMPGFSQITLITLI